MKRKRTGNESEKKEAQLIIESLMTNTTLTELDLGGDCN